MAHVHALIPHQSGSGPVLKALIQKMGVIPSLDRALPVDARRVGPTPGEAVAGMIACLLQGLGALARMEPFAAEAPGRRTRCPP